MKFRILLASAVIALGFGCAGISSAGAAPIVAGATVGVTSDASRFVETVQFRGPFAGRRLYGRAYYGRGGRYWGRPWPWVGLAAGVAAGAIIYNYSYRPRVGYYYDTYDYDGPYYYPRDYRGDPREICARNFRSFERNTGMYTTYGGDRRLCPYLQ